MNVKLNMGNDVFNYLKTKDKAITGPNIKGGVSRSFEFVL
jgi:hypothetical protein